VEQTRFDVEKFLEDALDKPTPMEAVTQRVNEFLHAPEGTNIDEAWDGVGNALADLRNFGSPGELEEASDLAFGAYSSRESRLNILPPEGSKRPEIPGGESNMLGDLRTRIASSDAESKALALSIRNLQSEYEQKLTAVRDARAFLTTLQAQCDEATRQRGEMVRLQQEARQQLKQWPQQLEGEQAALQGLIGKLKDEEMTLCEQRRKVELHKADLKETLVRIREDKEEVERLEEESRSERDKVAELSQDTHTPTLTFKAPSTPMTLSDDRPPLRSMDERDSAGDSAKDGAEDASTDARQEQVEMGRTLLGQAVQQIAQSHETHEGARRALERLAEVTERVLRDNEKLRKHLEVRLGEVADGILRLERSLEDAREESRPSQKGVGVATTGRYATTRSSIRGTLHAHAKSWLRLFHLLCHLFMFPWRLVQHLRHRRLETAPVWRRPIPLSIEPVTVSGFHRRDFSRISSLIMVLMTVQVYVAARTERATWLAVNDREFTRAYSLNVQYDPPYWWWFLAVDPRMMIGYGWVYGIWEWFEWLGAEG
jgi:hypothetical protein